MKTDYELISLGGNKYMIKRTQKPSFFGNKTHAFLSHLGSWWGPSSPALKDYCVWNAEDAREQMTFLTGNLPPVSAKESP